MSKNTRHAAPGSPLAQEKYCSSPALERGLNALPVSKRCSVLDDPADRELVWALQKWSHEKGGLKVIADELIRRYPDRFVTESMAKHGTKRGTIYGLEMVEALGLEIANATSEDFIIRGEFTQEEAW